MVLAPKKNTTVWIIALIAVVNALGYGIVIPILYSYSRQFGLTDFQNGLLFSIYSFFQFFATPVIGRLSDAYGRRPMLTISLFGTTLSFFALAFAPSVIWLFIARALDGATAGNIPVALAVISDSTEAKDRARGFGIIAAAFGFGFVFGPAISAIASSWSVAAPFIIAGLISAVATVLTFVLLPETNVNRGPFVKRNVFDFRHLLHALVDPAIGTTLLVTLFVWTAFSTFVYGFQPFSVELLRLSVEKISLIFTAIGIVGLVSQVAIIPRAVKLFGERQLLLAALATDVFAYGSIFFVRSYLLFVGLVILHAFANGFTNPLIQALLSKETDARSQGSIMGVNASYQSIGQIVGPVIGGTLATIAIPLPFLMSSLTLVPAAALAFLILHRHLRRLSLV